MPTLHGEAWQEFLDPAELPLLTAEPSRVFLRQLLALMVHSQLLVALSLYLHPEPLIFPSVRSAQLLVQLCLF